MKIRTNFVSNSSTTSFCIFGTEIPHNKVEKIESLSKDERFELGIFYDDPWSGYVYIGKYWSSIEDDETGLQFKTKIKQSIENLGIDADNCRTIDVAYYDG